jgi:hypothetical protein
MKDVIEILKLAVAYIAELTRCRCKTMLPGQMYQIISSLNGRAFPNFYLGCPSVR